ncbi:DNA polymerase V [Ruminococcus sp. YE71]|uniref:Y-family DNA polymerase n=1 Tax=unclassified Ruminococcus TaxID=2608920 RepID=UPI00088A9F53|nr:MULTISPECIES: DNA methylase [unclassified Ruminococcus]SDA20677.1 DNA polymerase V [Ruminococcus sp. YE78]SFW33826.1 DNA polymerase V [Ruminococcus sp. YE71]
MSERTYVAIDLKSFYASVECAERQLDPLTTNLVVADSSRTEKTICLAVSPSLKAHGISGRARLFEVIQRVEQVNRERLVTAVRNGRIRKNSEGKYAFSGGSFDADALAADPSLELSYITATPRMRLYEDYSSRIYSIYLKYISAEDIVVYSIDEVFMDVTGYLTAYNMTAHELAMTMIREVLYETGITATAGIGTNLYLAKICMDIVAKHSPADKDGVRIAELDERKYRELLWTHRPLTDFWRIGAGISRKLEAMHLYTMGDVARASLEPRLEQKLYKTFGVNAELIIDHAWGWEPTTVPAIKSYRPSAKSISSGQVLKEPYTFGKCRLIVREMMELLSLDLVRKGFVTKKITLVIGYDRKSLSDGHGRSYRGAVVTDHYGRVIPKHAHGTENIDHYTSSTSLLCETVLRIYDRVVDPELLIRRVNVVAENVIITDDIPDEEPIQLDFFTDADTAVSKSELAKQAEEREHRLQLATLAIQEKYGKNALLKGMNFLEGCMTIERNGQIGGHKA